MHWVWATGVGGDKVAVNLDLVASVARVKTDKGDNATALFFGSIAVNVQGQAHYGNTQVLETPEQLFQLPQVEVRGRGHDTFALALPSSRKLRSK